MRVERVRNIVCRVKDSGNNIGQIGSQFAALRLSDRLLEAILWTPHSHLSPFHRHIYLIPTSRPDHCHLSTLLVNADTSARQRTLRLRT